MRLLYPIAFAITALDNRSPWTGKTHLTDALSAIASSRVTGLRMEAYIASVLPGHCTSGESCAAHTRTAIRFCGSSHSRNTNAGVCSDPDRIRARSGRPGAMLVAISHRGISCRVRSGDAGVVSVSAVDAFPVAGRCFTLRNAAKRRSGTFRRVGVPSTQARVCGARRIVCSNDELEPSTWNLASHIVREGDDAGVARGRGFVGSAIVERLASCEGCRARCQRNSVAVNQLEIIHCGRRHGGTCDRH